jgi:hypothetical protein
MRLFYQAISKAKYLINPCSPIVPAFWAVKALAQMVHQTVSIDKTVALVQLTLLRLQTNFDHIQWRHQKRRDQCAATTRHYLLNCETFRIDCHCANKMICSLENYF